MCLTPMPISLPRSCSDGAFIKTTITEPRCARTLVCRVQRLVRGRPLGRGKLKGVGLGVLWKLDARTLPMENVQHASPLRDLD
jgi:hypothetical protein